MPQHKQKWDWSEQDNMQVKSLFDVMMPIFEDLNLTTKCRTVLLQKMNEIRKNDSTEFAEWLSGLGYQQYDGPDRWISQEESGNKVFTTKELYQRFLLNHKI